jgi:hypothetical protein
MEGRCVTNPDFIEQLITIYKDLYLQNKGVEYISMGKGGQSSGKDRQAIGTLLAYIKSHSKDDPNTEQMKQKFVNLFKACFTIKDNWIVNNLTLSIIASKINEIILLLKNNGSSKTTYYKGFDGDSNKWNSVFAELQAEAQRESRQIGSGEGVAEIGDVTQRELAS